MAPSVPTSSRDKVRAHRENLRRQGLKPFQIWIPDVNSPEFIEQARQQSLAAARSSNAKQDQDFIDSISEWSNEDIPEWIEK